MTTAHTQSRIPDHLDHRIEIDITLDAEYLDEDVATEGRLIEQFGKRLEDYKILSLESRENQRTGTNDRIATVAYSLLEGQ